jgi:hypothetical protein
MRKLTIAGLVLGACLAMTLPASAHGHFRGGGFAVVPAFGGWGWHDPFFYGSYGPYGLYPSVYSDAGEVQLKTNVKTADVFINGAYAGKAGKLKSMWLRPNTYSLEIRAPGVAPYAQRIFVVPGKTLKVDAYFSNAPHS